MTFLLLALVVVLVWLLCDKLIPKLTISDRAKTIAMIVVIAVAVILLLWIGWPMLHGAV